MAATTLDLSGLPQDLAAAIREGVTRVQQEMSKSEEKSTSAEKKEKLDINGTRAQIVGMQIFLGIIEQPILTRSRQCQIGLQCLLRSRHGLRAHHDCGSPRCRRGFLSSGSLPGQIFWCPLRG